MIKHMHEQFEQDINLSMQNTVNIHLFKIWVVQDW